MKPFSKSAIWAISKLHKFHLQRWKKTNEKLKEATRAIHALESVNDILLEDLEALEDLCGQKLLDSVEASLRTKQFNSANPSSQDIEFLNIHLERVASAPEEERKFLVQRASSSLGQACSQKRLCPLSTSISLYRAATFDVVDDESCMQASANVADSLRTAISYEISRKDSL